jgi:hypothetical protein
MLHADILRHIELLKSAIIRDRVVCVREPAISSPEACALISEWLGVIVLPSSGVGAPDGSLTFDHFAYHYDTVHGTWAGLPDSAFFAHDTLWRCAVSMTRSSLALRIPAFA